MDRIYNEFKGHDEMDIWDLYDEHKNIINGAYVVRDKDIIPEGLYHIAVWLFLVTKLFAVW